jgi:bacterioferritin-associated ferredoxin
MIHPKFVRRRQAWSPAWCRRSAEPKGGAMKVRLPPTRFRNKVFNMYICICNALTERHVTAVLDQDVRTPSAVYRRLDCVPQCGKCVSEIVSMLRSGNPAARAVFARQREPQSIGISPQAAGPWREGSAICDGPMPSTIRIA